MSRGQIIGSTGSMPIIISTLGSAMLAVFATIATAVAPASANDADNWAASKFRKEAGVAERSVANSAGRSNLLGSSDTQRTAKRASKGVQVASLGSAPVVTSPPKKSLSGGGSVNWVASSGCLNGTLRGVIYSVAAQYGSVTVSSTCRSASRNRSVGGAPKSMHLSGDAADFRVHGNWGAAYASLRSNGSIGGLKHYGGGLFHIDTGAKRSW